MRALLPGTGASLLLVLSFMPLTFCAGAAPERSPSPAAVILEEEKPAPEQPYGGAGRCGECHSRIYRFWRGTAHAASLERLDAGEKGNPSCLRCHSTGFGERTGYVDDSSTPELSSVGCESCHGAGGDHAGSAYPGEVPVSGPGGCRGCDLSRLCRSCHTISRSPAFDLRSALAAISCTAAFRDGVPGGGTLATEE